MAQSRQRRHRRRRKAPLEHQGVRPRLAWPERARAMLAVERGCVDRFLPVPPMMQVAQKEDQLPLILLVAAGRALGEVGLAVLPRHRWRQGGARPASGRSVDRRGGNEGDSTSRPLWVWYPFKNKKT